jgi:predicted transcriptional regulator
MDPRTSLFTDRVASLFEHDGLPPIAGRIFALLLVSEDALSLDQLSDDLGVSKASASTNARLLARFGLIEPVRRTLALPSPKVHERLERYEGALTYMADAIGRAMVQWRALPARRLARTGSAR